MSILIVAQGSLEDGKAPGMPKEICSLCADRPGPGTNRETMRTLKATAQSLLKRPS